MTNTTTTTENYTEKTAGMSARELLEQLELIAVKLEVYKGGSGYEAALDAREIVRTELLKRLG